MREVASLGYRGFARHRRQAECDKQVTRDRPARHDRHARYDRHLEQPARRCGVGPAIPAAFAVSGLTRASIVAPDPGGRPCLMSRL
ncbi:hypothetical protein GCM10009839_63710 [Catenulispora yoronensis]|uniref:Uncharacterized protein n=1 Tax=Catenulispora yoronensis TaxID=450799 RepID=A0ABP5GSE6_9ACTN